MEFIKMHGAGNDYVYVDLFKEKVADAPSLARAVSHRHFGIGGDGLILIGPKPGFDAEMDMYNADGSRSEMCGNGLRCVAKYVHDTYAKGKDDLVLMTGAGERRARIARRDAAGFADLVTLDMGAPVFDGLRIPTTLDAPRVFGHALSVEGETYLIHALSMGNPHCVIFVDDVANFPVEKVGPKIENHPFFPRRVNVEFVQVVHAGEVIQRTWERGSGETWACGTGAAAVCVASFLAKKTAPELRIRLLGGELFLEWNGEGSVRMTGPATEVFRGTWPTV